MHNNAEQCTDEQEFRKLVFISLGEIKAGNDGINDRLDKLNGSVARHEVSINDLRTAEAVRIAVATVTEKHGQRLWDAVKPIVYLGLGAIGALLLKNGDTVLKALGAR